eukprot:3643384-Rhodomonas_salina.2
MKKTKVLSSDFDIAEPIPPSAFQTKDMIKTMNSSLAQGRDVAAGASMMEMKTCENKFDKFE